MSDVGEMYAAIRERSREKRSKNRDSSHEILLRSGVELEVKNGGAHLIVRHNGKTADFWPGTGKYSVRGSQAYRRGVFRLMKDMGVDANSETRQ